MHFVHNTSCLGKEAFFLNILFACGGTGGHINPAIAIAKTIEKHNPDVNILFAGNPSGMEARLVPQAGYKFTPIEVKGFMRKLNWRNVKYNISSVGLFGKSLKTAANIIKDFAPDIVIGTGGYVSYPLLKAAIKMKIPAVAHESNAFPGLTTKMLAPKCAAVLLAVEEAAQYIDKKANCVVTGNPVREEMLFLTKAQARQKLGITEKLCILSFGGSLGAKRVNECVAELMAAHLKSGQNIHHIHATGSYGTELFPEVLRQNGIEDLEKYPSADVREYINDMPYCMAAADVVICRSGAMTLTEIQAAGKAAVLIPSPNVANNHQYYNAKVMSDKNAAVLIEEKKLTGTQLTDAVKNLLNNSDKLNEISKNSAQMAVLDANKRIYNEITRILTQNLN